MIVININNENNFTILANTTMRDRRLSAEARGVLGYLLTHSAEFEVTFESLKAEFGIGKDKLQKIISELKRYGYLRVTPKQDKKGRFKGWNWTVYGKSQETDFSINEKDRLPENPSDGETDCRENRLTENPADILEETNSQEETNSEEELKEEIHTNALAREFPLKELYEAFPGVEITPFQADQIITSVKPDDKAAWLATIKIYRQNFNPEKNRYMPDKVGNVLSVFKNEKKKLEKGGKNGKRNDNGRNDGNDKRAGESTSTPVHLRGNRIPDSDDE